MSKNNYWKGKHLPEEIKKQIQRTQQLTSKFNKPVLQYDQKGNFVTEYISAAAAHRYIYEKFGKKINIKICIKRKGLGAGFIWIYKTANNILQHIDTSEYIKKKIKIRN